MNQVENQSDRVPFLDINLQHQGLKGDILSTWERVLDKSWFILGQEVTEFEREFADYCESRFCSGVGNGLDALSISLRALGIGSGDRVVVPAHTFIATAYAVQSVGAEIVFCDVDEKTANLSASQLIRVKDLKSVKAVIPVHLYGQACEMPDLVEVAKAHHIKLIEDNAQSQGARSAGRRTGSFGDANATSFYPGKNLGALGDGGAITTTDPEIAETIRKIRNYGSSTKYVHDCFGTNSRLDELQAAVLRIKLRELDERNKMRRAVASRYLEALSGIEGLELPITAETSEHVYHLFVIKTDCRDRLQSYLAENGIETLVHYPTPVHLQTAMKSLNHRKGDFPVSEDWAQRCLSLPLYPFLTENKQQKVIDNIVKFFKERSTIKA